jgi:protein-tyrosine phosphatase
MAEVLAQAIAAVDGLEVEVQSASLLGLKDHPAHKHAVHVMAEMGLNLSNHLAMPLSGELMDWANHVLCMEVEQAVEIRKRFPENGDRVELLGPYGGQMEVEDPLGGWRPRFRRCRDEIEACVRGFMDRLDTA